MGSSQQLVISTKIHWRLRKKFEKTPLIPCYINLRVSNLDGMYGRKLFMFKINTMLAKYRLRIQNSLQTENTSILLANLTRLAAEEVAKYPRVESITLAKPA